jgi:DNA-binding NtrC family response regulator
MNVLIVDDQRSARRVLRSILETLVNVEVSEAENLSEARQAIEKQARDLIFIDIRLSDDPRNQDGMVFLQEVREKTNAAAIVVSALSDLASVRQAMRLGAHDYLFKDEISPEIVMPIVESFRSRQRLEREVGELRARVAVGATPKIIGSSQATQLLRETIRKVALSDRPVLITGPTGAGKELVVEAIHALGPRPTAPLLDLNCGAIPEALIESQLFGHERGAFTGADRPQVGAMVAVKNGTLFLDEIAELPLLMQPKLLRVLETARFRRVGSSEDLKFEGRVISATHADLGERVRQGKFREDLYYRLNVLTVRVTPLDDRKEDIPLLVAHFAAKQNRQLHFTREAMDALMSASWPGNIRELRNLVDRVAVFAESDVITADEIARHRQPTAQDMVPGATVSTLARTLIGLKLPDTLRVFREALVAEAMALAGSNKTEAASLLGIHRRAIERILRNQDDGE